MSGSLCGSSITHVTAVGISVPYSIGSNSIIRADTSAVTGQPIKLAVLASGWTAEVTFKGLSIGGTAAPTTTNLLLTVSSPGFDTSGNATSTTRTVYASVALRQPYPTETLTIERTSGADAIITFALSDAIYQGDSVTGVVALAGLYTASVAGTLSGGACSNGSAWVCEKPGAKWLTVPYQRAGSSFDVEMVVAHHHGRGGQQVAAVKFVATDGTNSAQVIVSGMVRSNVIPGTPAVPVYRGTLDTSGMTQGAACTVRAYVMPFIGPLLDSHATDADWPTPNLADLRFTADPGGTYGQTVAYVSTIGNDTTGAANTLANAAVARALPFLTIGKAVQAIRAFNNANYSRNDVGASRLRFETGTYSGISTTIDISAMGGATWHFWEPAAAASVTLQSANPGTYYVQPPDKTCLTGLALTRAGAGNARIILDGVLDDAAAGAPQRNIWVDSTTHTGTGGESLPMFYRFGLQWLTNNTWVSGGSAALQPYSNRNNHMALIGGGSYSDCGMAMGYAVVGTTFSNGTFYGETPSSYYAIKPKGQCIVSTMIMQATQANYFGSDNVQIGTAFMQQVLIERITSNTAAAFSISADTVVTTADNLDLQYVTMRGSRTNYAYNDTGSAPIVKHGRKKFCLLEQYNIKRDTFSPQDAGRVGNWSVSHAVGHICNVVLTGSASGSTVGPDSWLGEWADAGSNLNAGAPHFVNDQSFAGGGGGNGNYRLGVGSPAANRVPTGLATLPFDLVGTIRRSDGTGAAGSYEYVIP